MVSSSIEAYAAEMDCDLFYMYVKVAYEAGSLREVIIKMLKNLQLCWECS